MKILPWSHHYFRLRLVESTQRPKLSLSEFQNSFDRHRSALRADQIQKQLVLGRRQPPRKQHLPDSVHHLFDTVFAISRNKNAMYDFGPLESPSSSVLASKSGQISHEISRPSARRCQIRDFISKSVGYPSTISSR